MCKNETQKVLKSEVEKLKNRENVISTKWIDRRKTIKNVSEHEVIFSSFEPFFTSPGTKYRNFTTYFSACSANKFRKLHRFTWNILTSFDRPGLITILILFMVNLKREKRDGVSLVWFRDQPWYNKCGSARSQIWRNTEDNIMNRTEYPTVARFYKLHDISWNSKWMVKYVIIFETNASVSIHFKVKLSPHVIYLASIHSFQFTLFNSPFCLIHVFLIHRT